MIEFDWVEWFGYLASLVVLVSLTMSSIIKLRVINFIGCLLFASFAYFINSWPTIVMNLSIACINIYYLYHLYRNKEEFTLLAVSIGSEYFQHFIAINRNDIEKQITMGKLKENKTSFYMLRDNVIAGILVGEQDDHGTFTILLDYVTPKYRDFKLGQYYFNEHPKFLKRKGINKLIAFADDQEHIIYLQKMGFTKDSDNTLNSYYKIL